MSRTWATAGRIPDVHGDPEELRQAALRMGANLIGYAFGH
jgi:hypothetical protein